VGERGPCAVAGETFERLAIVIGDHDTCRTRSIQISSVSGCAFERMTWSKTAPWLAR
jgi:hypothetical protein